MESFKTIEHDSIAEIEEKKSKFIGQVFYVNNVQQAEQKLQEIRKKYFDAKHHCYAYRILENGIKSKFSDDGEPSGTAGAPILNILTKKDLCNVIVIVTRYFGGTLLGTGGLIRAYSEATLLALDNAGIVTQEPGEEMEVIIKYSELDKFKYYCHKQGITILNIVYDSSIKCIIETNKEEKEKIISKNNKNFQILKYEHLKEKYIRKKEKIWKIFQKTIAINWK